MRIGLERPLMKASAFYFLALATLLGVLLNFTSIGPPEALFYSAVVNGVIAVPIMVIVMFRPWRS